MEQGACRAVMPPHRQQRKDSQAAAETPRLARQLDACDHYEPIDFSTTALPAGEHGPMEQVACHMIMEPTAAAAAEDSQAAARDVQARRSVVRLRPP